tara:strand:- start:1206 stop:1754 length:549 start_codon:yes stop_codon:yes gene_type:complete
MVNPQSFIDPQRAAALRQQLAQRNQQAHQQSGGFGFDDFLTKILLPVGLGIATGVTGGVAAAAAPAAAAAGGATAAGTAAGGLGSAIGAGLAGGAAGMAAGQKIGSGIENLAEGNTGAGVGQLVGGLASGVAGFGTPLKNRATEDTVALAAPGSSSLNALRAMRQTPKDAQMFSFGSPYGAA